MSAAAYYHEPDKLPAGILALLVHGVFFALLFYGFNWPTSRPAAMSVELWQSLPDSVAAPPAQPKIEEVTPPPQPEKIVEPEVAPPPEKIVEPEIVMPDKKKEKTKPVAVKPEKKKPVLSKVEGVEAKPVAKKPDTSVADQHAERERVAQVERAAQAERTAQAERAARARAEQTAAIGRVVDEYTGKIVSKIRPNIHMPPDVANDARAEFLVTVLPGGSVLPPKLLKSSGNAAYDNAVERAILMSQPLPLPADVAMFNKFRELKLVFKPVE